MRCNLFVTDEEGVLSFKCTNCGCRKVLIEKRGIFAKHTVFKCERCGIETRIDVLSVFLDGVLNGQGLAANLFRKEIEEDGKV